MSDELEKKATAANMTPKQVIDWIAHRNWDGYNDQAVVARAEREIEAWHQAEMVNELEDLRAEFVRLYPADIFTPNGTSSDAISGSALREVAPNVIAKKIAQLKEKT